MGKNNYFWILIVLLIIVIVLILPRGLSYGGVSSMHTGYGMMGGGMIGFWWIIPVIGLVLIIAAGVWLGNFLTFRKHIHPSGESQICPKCSKPTEADWTTCPYCSEPLKK